MTQTPQTIAIALDHPSILALREKPVVVPSHYGYAAAACGDPLVAGLRDMGPVALASFTSYCEKGDVYDLLMQDGETGRLFLLGIDVGHGENPDVGSERREFDSIAELHATLSLYTEADPNVLSLIAAMEDMPTH